MNMIEFYKRPWRNHFETLLAKTTNELIITSPYIKKAEAEFICDSFSSRKISDKINFTLLTDLRSQSILDNSLDIEALQLFQSRIQKFELVTLPRLHAKVYLFDNSYAVIGSSNLTPSGFEYNYEYNVGFREKKYVQKIKSDISEYSTFGSKVEKEKVDELSSVAKEVKEEYQEVIKPATSAIRKRFNETLKKADVKFTEALVGKKTAYSIFKEAVIYCLTKEPLSTKDLQARVQFMLPDLCVDVELIINGQKFGKVWKHQVRTVLNDLRRRGNLKAINKIWRFEK